jgi:hypothetical protein
VTTKTITQVVDEPRKWKGQHGDMFTLSVTFEDGDLGDVNTNKAERVVEIVSALKALVGKPSEFELQDGGKWPSGDQKPWRIKDYPGKPGGSWQGGSAPSGGGRKSSPEDRSSIEAQVAAKIAGEVAVQTVGQEGSWQEVIDHLVEAVPRIAQAIRSAAQDSGSESRPSGGPLSTSGPDEAEGDAPASPSGWSAEDLGGQSLEKLKGRATVVYGSAGAVMKAARQMFPDVRKVADIDATMYEVLIEDKEQG